jgi:uncharacterized protein (TIGR03435 family)
MRKVCLLVCVAIAGAVLAAPRPQAQSFTSPMGSIPAPDPNIPLYFEAASVKPSDPAANPGGGIRRQPGGRFNTINAPLKQLIVFAYELQDHQLVGAPDWITKARYDIVAKFPGDPQPIIPGSGADHMMLAMRTLLADRFKLVVHKETRQLDIYNLVLAAPGKPGPAMKPSGDDCTPEKLAARRGGPPPAPGQLPPVVCGMIQQFGRLRFGGFPLSLFARGLANRTGRAVVDKTGLTGNWDFEMTFAADPIPAGALPPGVTPPAADPDAPDFFTALREQVGMKLDSAKGPVEVMVVDGVQPPTPD